MKNDRNKVINKDAGTMSSQKTNEDFNKKKPEPKDFLKKKRIPTEKIPNIGKDIEDKSFGETAKKNEVKISEALNEKIINGDANVKYDINRQSIINSSTKK